MENITSYIPRIITIYYFELKDIINYINIIYYNICSINIKSILILNGEIKNELNEYPIYQNIF